MITVAPGGGAPATRPLTPRTPPPWAGRPAAGAFAAMDLAAGQRRSSGRGWWGQTPGEEGAQDSLHLFFLQRPLLVAVGTARPGCHEVLQLLDRDVPDLPPLGRSPLHVGPRALLGGAAALELGLQLLCVHVEAHGRSTAFATRGYFFQELHVEFAVIENLLHFLEFRLGGPVVVLRCSSLLFRRCPHRLCRGPRCGAAEDLVLPRRRGAAPPQLLRVHGGEGLHLRAERLVKHFEGAPRVQLRPLLPLVRHAQAPVQHGLEAGVHRGPDLGLLLGRGVLVI
mmetsp:Transcript_75779/g.214231  ORF Transcript_75779/g.214231 Transcript_75779/m.214231 type:complete len:282 (-) Transcript_75779:786-1631(-)